MLISSVAAVAKLTAAFFFVASVVFKVTLLPSLLYFAPTLLRLCFKTLYSKANPKKSKIVERPTMLYSSTQRWIRMNFYALCCFVPPPRLQTRPSPFSALINYDAKMHLASSYNRSRWQPRHYPHALCAQLSGLGVSPRVPLQRADNVTPVSAEKKKGAVSAVSAAPDRDSSSLGGTGGIFPHVTKAPYRDVI